ncbi:MAG TPA: DUF4390 domain-containing protein [Candidatus Eisenbacteria bacterium]
MGPRARLAAPAGAALAALLLAGLGAAPGVALARDDMALSVGPVESVGGAIRVSYRVGDPFTPRLTETLYQGMPATVSFEVGLWKRRTLWFDKLVVALRSEHKVVYDPWAKAFRIGAGGIPTRTRSVPTLDSLTSLLFSERRLPIALASALDSTGAYYVSVRVLIRPLSPEDLGEVEDWLAGNVKDPEGGSHGLPRYLLGLAVSLSGLGDRTAIGRSERFVPARLAMAAPAPNP